MPIEEVQAGDWVWARDEVTGEVRLCEVEETYRNESPVILEVTAGGETLATTPGHPFWVVDHGWKDAGELEVGDRLVTLRGESVVVEDIRRRPVPEAVYNFSVAGLHTYFVGQGGIWVHNNSGSGCGGGGGASDRAKLGQFLEGDDVAEAASHAKEVGRVTGVVDRAGADARRAARMKGHPLVAGKDRDEFPPAVIKPDDPSKVSVKPIDRGHNRRSGRRLRDELPSDGTPIEIDP